MNITVFETALVLAGIGQILLAIVNSQISKILNWKPELEKVSSLVREVFHVHTVFISIILLIFGVITLRFYEPLSQGKIEMGRWFAGGIATFWGVRTAMQWLFYSSTHWKGKTGRTFIHFLLTFIYGMWSTIYTYAALV